MAEKKIRKPKVRVPKVKKMFHFVKQNKVSVWYSQYPYAEIPDEYFEERFSREGKRAQNTWSDNYRMAYFLPDGLETNGAEEGTIEIRKAVGTCSGSKSYIDAVMSKAKRKKVDQVTWVVLLFDTEYSTKDTGMGKDDYLNFLGAFSVDEEADSVFNS